jgi:glycosyltransferase involved in cell wall biosynthesis
MSDTTPDSSAAFERFTVSVLIPVFNEEDGLEELHNRVCFAIEALECGTEIIYVNDGSRDGSKALLDVLRENDSRVTLVNLSRNFGKEIALTAGLDKAVGDAVIILDADLQDPPELIPEFVRLWRDEGYDNVYGQRTRREGETWAKRATAFAFYRVMRRLSDIDMPADTGDFRLLSRRAIEALRELREQHRFMKGLFAYIGFPSIAVPYVRDPRHAGTTNWNYLKLFAFALEGITSHSYLPLRAAGLAGLVTAIGAFLYGAFIAARTLLYGDPVAGYPSMVTIMLFLGGVQLLSLGIIGEYIGRIYNETKKRSLYFVSEYSPSSLAKEKVRAGKPVKNKVA